MNLDTYLEQGGSGAAALLAKHIGVHPVLVSQWRNGSRQVPAARCPDIERATGGAVRCEDLRPDVDWNYLRTAGDFEVVR
jgi:DNA-binding transcriptional regulator YdaS (Cro superfamily)